MIGDAIVPALGSTDVGRRNFDLAPCGLLSTNADGDIVDVNDTFVAMTGFTRDELVGRRTFAQLLSAGGRIYHETHYAPMLRMQGSARGIAVDIVTATRARISVLVNSQVEYDEHGLPALVHTAVFDAADRREYERELLRSKQRAEESETRARALARTLQQTLIPPTPPTIPGLDVAGAYRPARSGDEVGGDFYDVFAVTDDDWVIVIGDVCGKGVEAAVITALARYTLRTAAVGTPRPSRMLYTLNDVLIRNGSDRFVTNAVLRVRSGPTGWRLRSAASAIPHRFFCARALTSSRWVRVARCSVFFLMATYVTRSRRCLRAISWCF